MNGAGIVSAVADESASSVEHERILYGLMAEFEEHEHLLEAAKRAYAEGYRRMDAYSPFPIEGLAESLGHVGIGPVTDPKDLAAAIKRGIEAVKMGEPTLIDVVTQPR